MIEINLLPGDGKKKRRAKTTSGATFQFQPSQWLAGITEKITDKDLLGAIGAGALSAVLVATAKAEATRDSLYRQIAVIKSIDDSRYLWSHLLYEISNALPQYTWLTSISQTSAPRSAAALDSSALPRPAAPGDTTKPKVTASDRLRAQNARAEAAVAAAKKVTFRILGQTVDIQALTRFMKALEASPFIQNVQLTRSELVLSEGKEVTQFLLEAESQTPPPFVIKTVPLVTSQVQ